MIYRHVTLMTFTSSKFKWLNFCRQRSIEGTKTSIYMSILSTFNMRSQFWSFRPYHMVFISRWSLPGCQQPRHRLVHDEEEATCHLKALCNNIQRITELVIFAGWLESACLVLTICNGSVLNFKAWIWKRKLKLLQSVDLKLGQITSHFLESS